MKDLQQLAQEVERLRKKVREARRAEKDVFRLVEWLDELVDEAEDYRNQPWYDKKKLGQSHSFFFKGQTRQGREVAKRFLRWKASRRGAAEVEEEAGQLLDEIQHASQQQAARETEDRWKAALALFEDSPKPQNDPAMAAVDLIILDLTGDEAHLERTLRQGRIDFSSFQSARLLSAYDRKNAVGIDVEVVESGYFDVFARLDERIEKSSADFTFFLNAGTALLRPLDLPENWRKHDVLLPRAIDLSSEKPTPLWDRLERIKNSLFPLHPPCFLARNESLRRDPSSFQHFLSYRPWHLWLQALDGQPGPLQLTTPSAIIPSTQEPNLSEGNRLWLEANRPELIPELRGAQEEWDILKHDLVNRVVEANHGFFQEWVGYYAAVTQTGIRR